MQQLHQHGMAHDVLSAWQAKCCHPRRPSSPSCVRLTSTSQKLGQHGIAEPFVDLEPAASLALRGGRAERRTRSGQRIRNS